MALPFFCEFQIQINPVFIYKNPLAVGANKQPTSLTLSF